MSPKYTFTLRKDPNPRTKSKAKEDGVPVLDAIPSTSSSPYVGFQAPTKYAKEPQNRYQREMREGSGELVRYQYTQRFSHNVVER